MASKETQNVGIQARYCQPIGQGFYLFNSHFNGQTFIHIRKVLDGKILTKEGITLNLQSCNELFTSLPFLEDAVHTLELDQDRFYSRHLGENWHVNVQNGFKRVDIRKFWYPEDTQELQATKKGVLLTFDQVRHLRNGLGIIDSFVPELRNVVPCYTDPNHNVESCPKCTPK